MLLCVGVGGRALPGKQIRVLLRFTAFLWKGCFLSCRFGTILNTVLFVLT